MYSVRFTVTLIHPASSMFAFVFLLSCVVNVTESEVIGSHEPVKVTVGQDAILPCHLEPPFDVTTLTVLWERNEKEVHVYRSMRDDLDHQDERFKDRTSLFRDEMIKGNISLKLTNITELDEGTYACSVPKLYSQVRIGYVILIFDPVEKSDDGSQTNNETPSELICSDQPIVAQFGDDVILPCHLEPPISVRSETVEWTRPGLDPEYVHVHKDGRLVNELQNPSYNYRTRLFVDQLMNGNVSMKIFEVKPSDTGLYKCFLPSIQKEASIKLIVGGSDVIGSHEQVKVTVGQDAILPCHLKPPLDMTTLTVEWARNGKEVHLYRSRTDDLVRQDENFKDRTSLFHDEMIKGNISLKLTNVTELDEGIYTCFVPKLQSQVRRDYIILIVDPVEKSDVGSQTNNETGDTGVGPGAIAGIVIGIVFVIAVICIAVYFKKKRGRISVCAGREERRNKGRNMEDRQEDNPEETHLNDIHPDNS